MDQQTAVAVAERINKEIFVPVQNAKASTAPKTEAPTPAPSPVAASVDKPSGPIVPPMAVSPTTTPSPLASTTNATIVAPPSQPAPPPPPISPAPAPVSYKPTMRTMAHDVEAMQDGHVPAPVPYTTHHDTASTDSIPLSVPIRPPTPPLVPEPLPTLTTPPVSAAPLEPKPAEVLRPSTPVSAPSEEVVPPHPVRTFNTPNLKEVQNTLQKYGIDPYREAVE